MKTRQWIGFVLGLGYVATIVAANWAIQHVGNPPPAPGAPHTIPVWFGVSAPSGVLFAGLAFTLRDLVQETVGRWMVVAVILAGAGLSAIISPSALALASGAAFLFSELADFSVYTPLVKHGWLRAVFLSNLVGLVLDSILFLLVAFHSLQFLPGQVIGKAWMTLVAVLLLGVTRRAVLPRHARTSLA